MIPLSQIDHLDKMTYWDILLPSAVAGAVAAGLNLWLNPRFEQGREAAISIPCTGLVVVYCLQFNRRKLKRNKVGERIAVEVIGEAPAVGIPRRD